MARPVWMGNFQPKALAAPAAFTLTCARGVLPKTSDTPSISNSDCTTTRMAAMSSKPISVSIQTPMISPETFEVCSTCNRQIEGVRAADLVRRQACIDLGFDRAERGVEEECCRGNESFF